MNCKKIVVGKQEIRIGDTVKVQNDLSYFQKKQGFVYQDDYISTALVLNYKFESVSLYYHKLEQSGESANLLFALSESQIKKIDSYGEGMYIMYTDLLEIILPNALINKEVKIKSNDVDKSFYTLESDLVKALEDVEEMYLSELLTIKERENQKYHHYRLAYDRMKQKYKWA